MISHDEEEPKTIKRALYGPTPKVWIKAMKEEINSMKSNQVVIWLIYRYVIRPLGTSGFSIINIRQIGKLANIKLDW